MRWPIVGRTLFRFARAARGEPFAHGQQLLAEPGQILGQLQHGLVLFRDMALKIGDLLLERLETVVHGLRSDGLACARIISNSGTTTR